MIRAPELTIPPAPRPYYLRRLEELVAQGRAVVRQPGPQSATAAGRMQRTAARLSRDFAARLRTMQDAIVYLVPHAYKLAFRHPNPRPALNGKVYVPPLPAGARFVGRYSFPFSRRAFVRDLLETMKGPPA